MRYVHHCSIVNTQHLSLVLNTMDIIHPGRGSRSNLEHLLRWFKRSAILVTHIAIVQKEVLIRRFRFYLLKITMITVKWPVILQRTKKSSNRRPKHPGSR